MVFEILIFLVTLGVYVWGLVTAERKKWWLIGGGVGVVLAIILLSWLSQSQGFSYLFAPGASVLFLLFYASDVEVSYLTICLLVMYVAIVGSLFGFIAKRGIVYKIAAVVLIASYVAHTYLLISNFSYT